MQRNGITIRDTLLRISTCSRAEHELQVRLGAMSDLTRVVPLDLDAVDVGGGADHDAGRFRLPTAQADMGAQRESGRVWALPRGRLRRLGQVTSVVRFLSRWNRYLAAQRLAVGKVQFHCPKRKPLRKAASLWIRVTSREALLLADVAAVDADSQSSRNAPISLMNCCHGHSRDHLGTTPAPPGHERTA